MLYLALFLFATNSALALVADRNVLIIQNKGGGHGELGYHLSKKLCQHGVKKVTILQDEFKKSAQPFCQYSDLSGVEIVVQKLADLKATEEFLTGKKFDTIIDNYNKDVSSTKLFTDAAKSWGSDYLYVSSGGMYKGTCPEGGFSETDEVKADNECRVVEEFIASSGVTWTSFRPQYIYGSNTNKRSNLDWFLDRVTRRLPLPIPGDATQLIALSNAKDVASMIASAAGNAAAANQVFNCGTDKFLAYGEVARLCARAAGVDPADLKIVSYDPKKLDFKPDFPYREKTFVVSPAKAKAVLGWEAKSTLEEDLPLWFAQYLAGNLFAAPMDTSNDDKILASV